MTPPTLVNALRLLRTEGYLADFSVTPEGALHCGTCGKTMLAGDAVVESTTRFEGASNPDDQAVLFGLRCEKCDVRGVLVSAYGPTASAEEAAVLSTLSS